MNENDRRKLKEMREKELSKHNPVLREKSYEFLLNVVKATEPKRILEIGSNVGLTGIAMLLNGGGTLDGIELDEERIKLAYENYKAFGVFNRARIFPGDASKIIPFISGKYDLIFVDGPKGHYYEYLQYLINYVNEGGIIFADNVLYKGYLKGEKVPHRDMTIFNSMKKYVDTLKNDQRFCHYLLDIEDGLSVAVRIK